MKALLRRAWVPAAVILILAAAGILFGSGSGGRDGKSVRTSADNKKPTVIVDPGHGGADGGAVSVTGVKESVVNLDIAMRLDALLGFFGSQVVMTRSSEELVYPESAVTIREKKAADQRQRLGLINASENAVVLSLHQNTYPSGGPSGAQVLFAPTAGSKEFAVSMQQLLIGALDRQNRRTAAQVPESILLMNSIKCPAVLIECGFLSNAAEEQRLMTDAYRLKIAAVIAAGYLQNREYLAGLNE